MKKIISLFLALAVCSGISSTVLADDISVELDGEKIEFVDQSPIEMNDRVLVPLRAIFEALGATVVWNDVNQSAISKKAGKTVQVRVDSLTMLVDGKLSTLDQPAILMNDRILVPVRAVSEGLGAKVEWDEASKTVIITQ